MNRHLVWFFLCSFFFLLAGGPAHAQLQRLHKPYQLWAGTEVNYQVTAKHAFYFDNQWRHASSNPDGNLARKGLFASFEDIRVSLGYVYALTANWSVETAQRISWEKEETKWYNRFMLNYERKLGPVGLETRFMYEHIRPFDKTPANQKLRPENRVRGNIGGERPFRLGRHQFELMAEAELLFYLNEKTEPEPRLADRSRLEAGLTYVLSPSVGLTLFGIRQVRYKREQPPAEGPGPDVVKLNEITPIWGLELEVDLP